ncbi:hypothetical protein ABL78_6818 [Leptomonas seymouri]|uniref:Uncharacterized protein n=1 Tax=Leptomonas seymouri TaxID=5684 RepID=A0A0N1PAE5_LEPSE|nr:hypothetical protein ABL78_6818 [Leptomonas seymouri]|eukprot:KPI84120.1 hypothetical protein ABL78_6818 [Leptomonas seymouri]
MLEVYCNNIFFDETAVNDIPTYRPIRVQNKTDTSLSVNITTSSSLLRFQLCNENYEAIQQVGLRDSLYVYNEAFDLVGLITSFELAPREEQQIIVSFRAEPAAFSHLITGAQATSFNGTVHFTATSAPSTLSSPLLNNATSLAESDAAQAASPVSSSQQQQQQQQHTESFTIPFSANVYVSFLKLSSAEIQVTMSPNKTQVVDFTVTNFSCQPVLFLIRDQAMPLKGLDVALYEADKFEDPKLGHRILLDSYASMTFSLMLRSSSANPNTQQQYHTVLQCDNLRDNRNTTFLHVSINVGAESQGDVLAFPDTAIDFGDVYRGTKAFAQIRVQSIHGREDAVVRLADTDRRKYDGKFSLMKGEAAVDELTIAAQKGNPFSTITLMYQPSYNVDSTEAAKKKFDVELLAQSASRANSQRVVIRCAAMLYTSNIVVSQRSVNFGDCQVGQSKRYTLQIENHSPLQGKIVVQLRSKIIQIEGVLHTNTNAGRELREEFTIAPSASLPLTLKITPQRVNPMYGKQLTIINASNPTEDRQVINIEANNMAPLDTKLHDELYSWKCDLGGNIDNNVNTDGVDTRRGPPTLWAISNVPLLIPYSVQSKVDHMVVLNLRSSSPEIEVFYSTDVVMCDKLNEISAQIRRLCFYGEEKDSRYLTNESAEQLFKAREELLKFLSVTSRNITNRIILEPYASLKAYALIIRTPCPTEPHTKEDGISIAIDGIEAPRFVRLSYRLCGTMFELNGQKTKNFGEVNIGVKKTTKLPIVNRCNSFLFLHISKSRSVTAEHIRMEHSDKQSIFLTIRPYASREIELTLYPGIKGVFHEKIHVTNVLSIQNSISMTIKAIVTKADTFEISPDSWMFEMMVPPSANVLTLMAPSAAQAISNHGADDSAGASCGGLNLGTASSARAGAKFTVANTSNARRQIIARVELSNSNAGSGVTVSNPYLSFPGVKVAVQLDMTLTGASSVSTRKLEEQVEKLEQKLKIYVRKKKMEKADNARRKIEAYKLALKGEEVDLTALESTQSGAQGTTDHELSESEDEGSTNALQALKNKTQQSDLAQLLRREGVALPSMGAGESVMITLFLVCKRVPDESIPVSQSQTMNILFYEARDQEANRIIPIDMVLMRTPGDSPPQPVSLHTAATVPFLTCMPSAVSAVNVQGQTNADASRADSATNPLTTSSPKAIAGAALAAASVLPSARVQQVRPPPSIRLATPGAFASGGGGRLHSTFMGHPLLVLRNCIVNDQTEFCFLVEADGDTTIVVLEPRRCGGSVPEVLDARFKLFPRNGHVRQQEPLRIVVECTARSVGPQKYFIPVKNIRNAADVHYLTVEMNPTEEVDMLTTEPKELFFRDVLTPCAPSQLEAQVVLIRSRFPFPHALVVRTNKPSQLALFEDASCTVPLMHPIRRVFVKETVRVYVQLRPGARYVDSRACTVHAGVLVEALAPNPAVSSTAFCVVGKAVLRAVAYVGSGLVEVLQLNLELGCVRSTQHYVKTQFTLRNTSYSFPLRIGLVPSSPLVEVAEETTHGEELTLAPLEEHTVPLVLHLPAPGLVQEHIDVVNHSSAQDTIRVSLSALRLNDGITQIDPTLNTTLSFPMVAVVRGEDCKALHLHQPVSCSIKMANYHSNREVVLATAATTQTARVLPLWFHTSEEELQVRSALEEEQRQAFSPEDAAATAAVGPRSGITAPPSTPTNHAPSSAYVKGRVGLQAGRVQVVMWTLTELPALTAGEVEAVLQHQLVTITSTLQVCVTYTAHSAKATAASPRSPNNRYRGPAVGQCVLLVPVTMSLAMSEGRAEPATVNLGLVAKPASPPASPTTTAAEKSSDEGDSTEAEDGAMTSGCANNNNEEAVFAARMRRRRRVRLAQLRRPDHHQQFSSYSAKSGLQQSPSHNMVVSFRLVNLSAVMPLPLKVECPPVIRFSQTRMTLAPGATMSVDATLNFKLITTQGSFRYEAFFVNEWNPENDMAVCITGQHYWKVFKIVLTDTEEELRDAVTLSPLRVEPSLQAPLSELKLAFVATEPDVEFDLHVQPNPQIEGLLELLLLHYDATSAATHLSFLSGVPVASASAASNAAAGGVTSSGAASVAASAAATSSLPGTAAPTATTTNTAAAAPGGGAAGGSLSLPISVAVPAPVAGVGPALHNGAGAPSSFGEDGMAAGNVGQSLSQESASSGIGGSTGGASAATATTPINAASTAKSRRIASGPSGGTGGGNAATARSQRLRLRCMLSSGDLASLVQIFYGFRRSRTNAAVVMGAGQGSGEAGVPTATSSTAKGPPVTEGAGAAAATTASNAGGSSASSLWTYDRIAEVERRSAALVSNNVWLGTVWVANPFTEDEELQVYGTLGTFRTFSAPSKVSLRPSRISVETPRCAAPVDGGSRTLPVGYVGEIAITNEFDVYVADLSVVVLINDRLGVPLEIDVRGGHRVVPPSSTGSAGGGGDNTPVAEVGSVSAAALSTNVSTSSSTIAPIPVVATSFIAAGAVGGAPPVSQPHCLQLGPRETVVLTVVVRAADTRVLPVAGGGSATTSLPPLSLTSLEKFVSVLMVDDNVPFSYQVSRVNVVTLADGVEALPTVTLSAATQPAPSSASEQTAMAAAAMTSAAGDAQEAEKSAGAPIPPFGETAGQASARDETPAAAAAARVTGDDSLKPLLLPPAVMELSAIETTSVETADANSDGGGGGACASAELAALQPRVSGAEVALESPSVTAACNQTPLASTATPVTTVVPSIAPDSAVPRHWVLSLRNCDPLPGCGGAYISNFSIARDDTYDLKILITNHLPSTAVRYTAQVVSQSPQVWLLLTSTSGVLEGGETQPLRLQVLSSDVGSFVGYVAITNTHDTREVVYLRVNAEIFVPGAAGGLFDAVAMNGGHRLATTNAVHSVDMGALYGPGTTRTLIALEIVNKGSVALEFPVSVVHPMRQELRPIPRSVWYGSTTATSARRRRHPNAAAAAATANTPNSLPMPSALQNTAQASAAVAGAERPLHNQPLQLSPYQHRHHHPHSHRGVPHVCTAATASAAAISAAPFEGRLVVSHIHNVATHTGQKYFVVDPRSPLRLAFSLSCTALHDIPDGYSVCGEVDVVFKCKQARDVQFTFNAKFEACKPTFSVALEYDMDAVETAAAAAANATTRSPAASESDELSHLGAASPPGMSLVSLPMSAGPLAARPVRATAAAASSTAIASARWAETEVAVTNLSRTHAQTFALFSQSQVLTLAPANTAPGVQGVQPGSQLLPSVPGGLFSEDGSAVTAVGTLPSTPAVEVTVAPQSVGVFVVRLDRLRAEALLNFDKDESKLVRPALCEHAYLYNKGNPRERVQLLFRQQAVSAEAQRQSRASTPVAAAGPVSPTHAEAKPVKSSGAQHFSERHIVSFAQRFSAVLTSLADRLPFVARSDDAVDGVSSSGGGGSAGESGAGVGGAKGGAGDYSGALRGTNLGGALRAAAANNAPPGSSTPVGLHRRGAMQHGRAGTNDDAGAVKDDRWPAALHGSHLHSSSDSTSDDSTATTTTSSSDEDTASENGDELEVRTAAGDADRTLNSTLNSTATEDSNGAVARTMRDVAEETRNRDIEGEGSALRVSGLFSSKLARSDSEGAEGDRRQPQPSSTLASNACMSSGESSVDALVLTLSSPSPLSGTASGSTRRGDVHRRWRGAQRLTALSTLHDLLVELVWLCDELLFYAILLRNSRHVEACGAFLVAAVSQHPVMLAWRRRRGGGSRAHDCDAFGRFLDTIDALPRRSNSTS